MGDVLSKLNLKAAICRVHMEMFSGTGGRNRYHTMGKLQCSKSYQEGK
jgi:hypothetical protein